MSVSMEPKRFIINGIVCNCGECKHYDKPYPNSYCSGCVEFNTIDPLSSKINGSKFEPQKEEYFNVLNECAVKYGTVLTELNLTLRMKGISFGEFCHRLGINI